MSDSAKTVLLDLLMEIGEGDAPEGLRRVIAETPELIIKVVDLKIALPWKPPGWGSTRRNLGGHTIGRVNVGTLEAEVLLSGRRCLGVFDTLEAGQAAVDEALKADGWHCL